jgi:hypothetical protein
MGGCLNSTQIADVLGNTGWGGDAVRMLSKNFLTTLQLDVE